MHQPGMDNNNDPDFEQGIPRCFTLPVGQLLWPFPTGPGELSLLFCCCILLHFFPHNCICSRRKKLLLVFHPLTHLNQREKDFSFIMKEILNVFEFHSLFELKDLIEISWECFKSKLQTHYQVLQLYSVSTF